MQASTVQLNKAIAKKYMACLVSNQNDEWAISIKAQIEFFLIMSCQPQLTDSYNYTKSLEVKTDPSYPLVQCNAACMNGL